MIDQIHIPHRSPDDPFRLDAIHDDLVEQFPDDPTQRRVQNEVAYALLVGSQPDTIGEAIELLEQSSPQARRELLDRARERAGLPTLTVEQARQAPPPRVSSGPARDAQGRIDALCGEPSCRNFEPGEFSQFAKVDVRRWYCPEHRAGREEEMKPYDGPRYGYGPSGAVVDLDELEVERAKAAEQERHHAAEREAAAAERAVDAEGLRTFEEAKRARDRAENRHQIGLVS